MIKKRVKRKYYYLVSFLLILFFTMIIFNVYSKKTTSKINLISQEYFQKEIYNKLMEMVYTYTNNNSIDDVLDIHKNADGEILYLDYNLNASYEFLKDVSQNIKKSLEVDKGIVYKIPFMIGSKSVFLSNLGPKIIIKMNYINSILTNVYTKITNYGLNNALVEAYVKITIDGRILTPVDSNKTTVSYDLLIASKIINGRIPEFYGNYLSSNSSIFDVPIK